MPNPNDLEKPMNTVNVELAERSYPIFVGAGLLDQLDVLLG